MGGCSFKLSLVNAEPCKYFRVPFLCVILLCRGFIHQLLKGTGHLRAGQVRAGGRGQETTPGADTKDSASGISVLVREAICLQRPAVRWWGLGPGQGLLSSSKIEVWLWSQVCPQPASLSHDLCHWPHGRAGLHLHGAQCPGAYKWHLSVQSKEGKSCRSLSTGLIMKLYMRLCCDLTNNIEKISLRKDQTLPERPAEAWNGKGSLWIRTHLVQLLK